MGILNQTPDSFYDRGRYLGLDLAMERARQMIQEGTDIIDVGGERAGPGEPVSVEEEIERVAPVIEGIRRESPIPISVDTFKPEVAAAGIEAGADIINSIGGFGNPLMRRVAATTGAAVVIMHIKGQPRVKNPDPEYTDVVKDVQSFLSMRARECIGDGIAADRIMIDPGPGFGKTAVQDLTLLRNLSVLTTLPFPMLLAVSRKPFMEHELGADTEGRLEGSLAAAAWGVLQGVRIVRTHDVQATKRVCRMTEAVLHPELVETPA